MKIKPRRNLLVIRKHKMTQLKADIAVGDDDEDKRLITGEVLSSGVKDIKVGTTIIYGKYALLNLRLKGEDHYFLDADDVVGFCDYLEK